MNYSFTDRVRKVLAVAREEAIRLNHNYLGPEHMLLALAAAPDSVAAAILAQAGIELSELRKAVERVVTRGRGPEMKLGELPYTVKAKKALEYAIAESRDLGHAYVGTEHLLLGLIREDGSVASVLQTLGLERDALRARLGDEAAGGHTLEALADVRRRRPRRRRGFAVRIDDASSASIYEQIVAQVQEAVATGRLAEGDRLPPVRRLADELDIAPGTVARAYSELERLGVVVTEGARGTRIAPRARAEPPHSDRTDTLVGLLRPVVVAAFHLGATADDLRAALEPAMQGIFPSDDEADEDTT
jgi:DNA-binding transcriptional regulator YhcF (GntR family)